MHYKKKRKDRQFYVFQLTFKKKILFIEVVGFLVYLVYYTAIYIPHIINDSLVWMTYQSLDSRHKINYVNLK